MPRPSEPRSHTGPEGWDQRLRNARRVDWRFLLPSIDLGRVALAGRPDDLLRTAIEDVTGMVPARLATGDGRASESDSGQYDTVVLSGRPGRGDLARAAASVGDQGSLVVEIDGPGAALVARRRGSGPGATARIERSLVAGGFEVRVYWAWPTIDRATAYAAVDDRVAVRALMLRRLGGRGRILADIAGRFAARSVATAFLPSVVMVAGRSGARRGLLERRLLPARTSHPASPLSAGLRPGLLMLTPRYRASAHVVGIGLGPDGAIRQVAKVARLPDDRSLAHEAAVLGALARSAEAAAGAPVLIDAPGLAANVGDEPWPILVESGLDGSPLDPATVRADRPTAVAAVEAWLATLPVGDPGPRTVDLATRLATALGTIECLVDGSDPGRRIGGLVERSRLIVADLARHPLARVFEHGDPAHPNLIRLSDGRIGAVDWERGEPDGLPLHDLTIALAYLAAAAASATSVSAQAAAFRDAMVEPDAWAAAALDRAAQRTGCDPADRPALVVAAWLRSTAWLADRLGPAAGTNARATTGPDQGLQAWLAADRAVALWDVAIDLAESA